MIFDPFGLVAVLNHHKVRYLLIGGLAAVSRGSPVVTNDLDICYDRHPDNLTRLAEALVALKATLRGAPADLPFMVDAQTLAAGGVFTFNTELGPLDVLDAPTGTDGYDDLISRATILDLSGEQVAVAAVDDLILMKEQSGRPKDHAGLIHLHALREELER